MFICLKDLKFSITISITTTEITFLTKIMNEFLNQISLVDDPFWRDFLLILGLFLPFSNVFIVNFEQVISDWE